MNSRLYGFGDKTYQALGGWPGVQQLVADFYRLMASEPAFERIFAMHPPNIEDAQQRLAAFLSGWTGGPQRYADTYGPVRLPVAHGHLPITVDDRDSWLACMRMAMQVQQYPADLVDYLIARLSVPAEGIRMMCEPSKAVPLSQFYRLGD